MKNEIYITTDNSKMDIDFIHKYLSNESYWAKGRSKERVILSIENSLCFGVFVKDTQVGFARLVTDYVVFAWLMDVFVDEAYRGKGVGKILMDFIMDYRGLQMVNGIGLRTNDAQGLYEKYDFQQISDPETWMLKKNK